MTLTETAQLLGGFGDFLSSIAVLATLVYLAVQVRQVKQQIVHASQITKGEAAQALMASISDSPYIAPILAKLGRWNWSDFGLADAEENIRFNAWNYAWWRTEEMNFRTNSPEQLATQEQLILAWLSAWGTPFWPNNRAIFDDDFSAKVDELYEKVLAAEPGQGTLQSTR